jgi:hypothetical protein
MQVCSKGIGGKSNAARGNVKLSAHIQQVPIYLVSGLPT